MVEMPIINRSKCQACGLCVSVCACGALVMVNHDVQVIEMEGCGWCTMCELVCPNEAITCPFEIVVENNQDSA